MSEFHRYSVVKMLSAEGNAISYSPHGPDVVMADAFDALRQQLADVSNERDIAQRNLERMIETHDELQVKLNASEARNAALQRTIDLNPCGGTACNGSPDDCEKNEGYGCDCTSAQSAPATDEQGAGA